MAGLEHEMSAGGGRGHLRASHADRERVIDTLKAAYVYGLVSKHEFDARVSQTFGSRTYAELALVTADLPAGLAAAQQRPRPAPAQGNAPAGANVRPGDHAIIATAIFTGLALVAALVLQIGWPLLGAVGSAFVSLFLLRAQIRGSRRDRRPGGQLPPQLAGHAGPGAGRQAASAASAEQLPYTSKPRRPGNADAIRRRSLRPQVSS